MGMGPSLGISSYLLGRLGWSNPHGEDDDETGVDNNPTPLDSLGTLHPCNAATCLPRIAGPSGGELPC
jgi:hypothetical protein